MENLEIQRLLQDKDFDKIAQLDLHPSDWAEIIQNLADEEQVLFFSYLAQDHRLEVFPYLDFDLRKNLLQQLKKSDVQHILNHLESDDRTDFLENLPSFVSAKYIDWLEPDKKSEAQTLLGYQENSIGRLMSTTYISLFDDKSIEQAISYIRKNGFDNDNLNLIYIIDRQGKLLGEVHLRKLLLVPVHQKIHDLLETCHAQVQATADQEACIQAFKQYDDRISIPVLNEENQLLGIVTVDDVLHASEEENTEDIQKFGGLEALDFPYQSTSILELVRKRAGWLILLFFSEMLTTTAMGHYEEEIQKAVMLSFFVPLIISSGGNSGSQAATLIIRALALGEIQLSSWWQVFRRELFSGALLGLVLGLIGFGRIAIGSLVFGQYSEHWFLIACTICFSLIGVVVWGTITGAMLPFFLKKMGLDPATSSAPFVATLSDVTGLIIYFTIASLVLGGTLI